MPAPTFLFIGPSKSGSTWLSHAVSQHPDVLTGSRKELNFFRSPAYERGLAWGEAQFVNGRPDAPAVGEFTPGYLCTVQVSPPNEGGGVRQRGVAERVAAAYGPSTGHDLRLIVCLRDPVARAVSSYFQGVRRLRFPPSVSMTEVLRRHPSILDSSRYGAQLERWLELFPRESLLVLCYEEDVRERPKAALRRFFEHVGVDPSFEPDLEERRNVRPSHFDIRTRHAPQPLRLIMSQFPMRWRRWPVWNFGPSPEERAALADRLRGDTERLEALLGRTFPWPETKGRGS